MLNCHLKKVIKKKTTALTINIKGELVDLGTPRVMGILNLTEDSFFDGGKYNNIDLALKQTEKMLNAGAFFIDVGAASSKPGSKQISAKEEIKKLLPSLNKLIKTFPDTHFSIDTYNSEVAGESLAAGASMINDISGGEIDSEMFKTVARFQAPYVMMHMQGTPDKMQQKPHYTHITKEIKSKLRDKNYFLGEEGSRLSGGEAQRVSIARCLFNEANILILDEPTSSLDSKTEDKILKLILRLKKKVTIIIVSHKKKPLKYCDDIYKINNQKLYKIK